MIEQRALGRTGLTVSALGLGCGAVGGLMVRGAQAEQERAVARAVAAGITYFDTAASYGDGESERNLGRVLNKLRPDVLVGTKVGISAAERGDLGAAVIASLEASLRRLGREHVDLFQLHNSITTAGTPPSLTPAQVLEQVVPALQRLREQGKTRAIGMTATGETEALHRLIATGALQSAQLPYNLLNPSAATAVPPGFAGQDFRLLLPAMAQAGMGVIVIRVLAAGALSGSMDRHPIAASDVAPIATGASYAEDVERTKRLQPLVEEGHAASLIEAAIRFSMSHAAVSTVLIGTATLEQLETAIAAAEKGKLPHAALDRIAALQRNLTRESAPPRPST